MKFYVNKIKQTLNGLKPLKEGEYYVGLFSECETKAEGSFAGYYSCEKYLNTNLIAYSVYKGNYLSERVGDVILVNSYLTEIQISTHMWTKVIEASNLKEAIKKFEKSEWRQWTNEIDEISKLENNKGEKNEL